MATTDSLSVQKQLNALFADRLRTERQVFDVMSQELRVAIQLKAVMEDVSPEELAGKLDEAAKATQGLGDRATETGDAGAKAMAAIADGAEKSKKSAFSLSGVFTGMYSTLRSTVGAMGGVVKSAFNIGKALLSIPFSIFKNLLADAAAFGGDTSFIQALEDIRKEFGSFAEGTSKNILGAYTTMNTQLQQVSGLSVWQVFGTPADQLKYLQEVASKAGSQVLQFGDELQKNAGVLATFDKGLGVGAENMKFFMERATVMGTSVTTQLNDAANYALQLGKDFGISSKILGREVGNMMKDVRNFGTLTQKEMTVAAVYTKKLGIEMKDLVGLVDKFDNFDKAAESAAMLSQAFGANVDAFKLMNEQDPAKRLDELRKSMAATGRSADTMSRQELHLLAQTAGLSDEAAKLAFSTKNQGLSYDQIQKQANKAETAQMRQADALNRLADNIERVVRSGGQMQGSFWQQFVAGFERGIKFSEAYRTAMMNVRNALWQTFWAGNKVGTAFAASNEVGFGRFMKAFGDTFSGKNVDRIMNGFVVETKAGKVKIGGVVDELTSVINGKQSFGAALANIKNVFHSVAGAENLKIMLESGKKMILFLAKGVGSGAAFVVKEVSKAFRFLAHPQELLDQAGAAGGGALSFGGQVIAQIRESFGDPKALTELKNSFFDLLLRAFDGVKSLVKDERFKKLFKPVLEGIMGAVFGPAALKTATSLAPTLLSALSNPIGAAIGGVVATAGAAVGVHDGIEKFGRALENDTTLAASKLEKQLGAAGAGIVQTLSFGAISDQAAFEMGKNIATYADKLSGKIDDVFGPNLGKAIKTNLQEQFGLLNDLGGLIEAVVKGDGGGIAAGLVNVFTRAVKNSLNGIRFVVLDIPAHIIGWLSSQMDKLTAYLWETLTQPDAPASIWKKVKASMSDVGSSFLPQLWSSFKNLLEALTVKLPVAVAKLGGALLLMFGKYVFSGEAATDLAKGMYNLGISLHNAFFDAIGSIAEKIPLVGPKIAAAVRKMAIEVEKEKEPLEEKAKRPPGTELRHEAERTSPEADQLQVDVAALADQKKTLEANLNDLSKFAESNVIGKIEAVLPQQTKLIEDFNAKLSASTLDDSLRVTESIVKSVNELNSILGDGNNGALKIGAKLKKFADNSGLGKNGTYEIRNRGIMLKLDLKVTMDAAEVEKAIVLRKESILFDAISDLAGVKLDDQHQAQLDSIKGGS